MEDTLEAMGVSTLSLMTARVLILVLMEDTLEVKLLKAAKHGQHQQRS